MSLRQERIADQIRDVISGFFQAGRLDDPRLAGVTITKVRVSPDLQLATVNFRYYDEDGASVEDRVKALQAASPRFRKKLSLALGLRRTPNLRFFFDRSVDDHNRIDELLANL